MTWGGIQNVSRPIVMCHWMSHCTPQPATSLASSEAHSTRRSAVRGVAPAAARAAGVLVVVVAVTTLTRSCLPRRHAAVQHADLVVRHGHRHAGGAEALDEP